MSYQLVFRIQAEQDISNAQGWYEVHGEGLARRFTDELDRVFDQLSEYPEAAPVIERSIRRISLRVFPFHVWYVTHADASIVRVLAVTHRRRDQSIVHDDII